MANALKKLIDIDLLAYFKSKLDLLLAGKVDKVDGKGLSSNDYTSTEKTKLSGVAAGAQVNVLEGIQKNGTTVPLTNKIANISVPTKTSELTNDSGFITEAPPPSSTSPKMNGTAAVGTETAFARGDHVHPSDTTKANLASPTFTGTPKAPTAAAATSTTQLATTAFVQTAVSGKANSADVYTKTQVDSLVTGALHYKGTKATVAQLPSTGNSTGDMWHVTETGGEYAWNGSAWEEMGSEIDMSGYVEDNDLGFATTAEIDALFTE